uniref:Uncharacterized protein n=1 Tax=Geladintestivirus 2 TaxID=3233134 RepID=A0AAU8MIR6_9CAUD
MLDDLIIYLGSINVKVNTTFYNSDNEAQH